MTEALKPTAEQVTAIDAFSTGENMTVEAGAGTGKTSTLRLMAGAQPNRHLLYIAYNTAIAKESAASFPSNCECRTAHSVAYRWLAKSWGGQLRERLNSPRMPARRTAGIIGSDYPLRMEDFTLSPERLASIAMQTVQRFCYTDSPEITAFHVPKVNRVDDTTAHAELAKVVVPLARTAWADLTKPDGSLRFVHDHYLKLWALGDPQLDFDTVLVDEAQDSNGVVTGVVRKQQTQVVAVGDRYQAIYGWRGASNAMDAFGSKHHVYLTQSFRFGQPIADEANNWLEVLESEFRLTGNPARESRLEEVADARAVLCRTNARAIETLIDGHTRGVKVALVGGGKDVASFARAALDLMQRGSTSHPELFPFVSWNMVQEYAREAGAEDLAGMVRLIDQYSPQAVIDAIEKCSDERNAQVTVSTAHKAKGREWESVRIANDFDKDDDGVASSEEAMLAYVAVTRAKSVLNRSGLKWIDKILEKKREADKPTGALATEGAAS